MLKDQRRRRWCLPEKAALVRRTYEPGMSGSLVAREEGVAASLLFMWRKLERQGTLTAVSAREAVAPASELAAARAEIAKLQGVLGKKTLENEKSSKTAWSTPPKKESELARSHKFAAAQALAEIGLRAKANREQGQRREKARVDYQVEQARKLQKGRGEGFTR